MESHVRQRLLPVVMVEYQVLLDIRHVLSDLHQAVLSHDDEKCDMEKVSLHISLLVYRSDHHVYPKQGPVVLVPLMVAIPMYHVS